MIYLCLGGLQLRAPHENLRSRTYVRVMGADAVQATVAALRAAHDQLAALPIDALTSAELVGVLDDLETLSCQLPTQSHRLLARLQAESTAKEMGAKSWKDVLAIRWRISTSEAGRRLDEAAQLGPRRTLTGEPLEPVLPCTALAQAHGLINREHVTVVRESMDKIPPAVDVLTRSQIEADLARTAIGAGPKELKNNADRTLFLLDQDGPEPDDTERARRRGVWRRAARPRQDDRRSKGTSPPKGGRPGRRSTPSTPRRGCATPPMSTPAMRGLRLRSRSTTTPARWPNASTTHWSPWAASR